MTLIVLLEWMGCWFRMASNFFITGLPRSRTAWLSAFMSSGDVFCHHELIKENQDVVSYANAMAKGYRVVGNADCGGMVFPDILALHDAIVIIERDPEEVIESLNKVFPEKTKETPEIVYELQKRLDMVNGLRIPYNEVNSSIKKIWEHCTGSLTGFDENRFNLMRELRITTTNIW
jgi:hypothetical protein